MNKNIFIEITTLLKYFSFMIFFYRVFPMKVDNEKSISFLRFEHFMAYFIPDENFHTFTEKYSKLTKLRK